MEADKYKSLLLLGDKKDYAIRHIRTNKDLIQSTLMGLEHVT